MTGRCTLGVSDGFRRSGGRFQASLRDAVHFSFHVPWVETHGYYDSVALRRRRMLGRRATIDGSRAFQRPDMRPLNDCVASRRLIVWGLKPIEYSNPKMSYGEYVYFVTLSHGVQHQEPGTMDFTRC